MLAAAALRWQDETASRRARSSGVRRPIVVASMITLTILIVLLALAVVTRLAVVAIEHNAPPQGQFIAVQGARLHVIDLGPRNLAGPPIVLIHGASANLQSMRQPLGDLLARDHRVILFDRPGHGWSERGSLGLATPQAQADMIA